MDFFIGLVLVLAGIDVAMVLIVGFLVAVSYIMGWETKRAWILDRLVPACVALVVTTVVAGVMLVVIRWAVA